MKHRLQHDQYTKRRAAIASLAAGYGTGTSAAAIRPQVDQLMVAVGIVKPAK